MSDELRQEMDDLGDRIGKIELRSSFYEKRILALEAAILPPPPANPIPGPGQPGSNLDNIARAVMGNAGDQQNWPQHRVNGWAPGMYSCTCTDCGITYWGDKRSIQCYPCASHPHATEAPEAPKLDNANPPELTDLVSVPRYVWAALENLYDNCQGKQIMDYAIIEAANHAEDEMDSFRMVGVAIPIEPEVSVPTTELQAQVIERGAMTGRLADAQVRAGLRMPLEAELQLAWAEVDGQKMTIRDLHAACDLKTTYGDCQKARADRAILDAEELRERCEMQRIALENIRDNTLNPALTMAKVGLEDCLEACHQISLRALLDAPTESDHLNDRK